MSLRTRLELLVRNANVRFHYVSESCLFTYTTIVSVSKEETTIGEGKGKLQHSCLVHLSSGLKRKFRHVNAQNDLTKRLVRLVICYTLNYFVLRRVIQKEVLGTLKYKEVN